MATDETGNFERVQARLKELLDGAGDTAKLSARTVQLTYRLFRDPRVPRRGKIWAAAALGYWLLPTDLLPEKSIPLLGKAEDLFLVLRALRILLAETDREIALEHWTGTPEELDRLRETLAGWDNRVRTALGDLVSWVFGERDGSGETSPAPRGGG